MNQSIAKVLVSIVLLCAHLIQNCNLSYATEIGSSSPDFLISIFVVPGLWTTDLETDIKQISYIANVITVATGRYQSFQNSQLRPTLDAADRNGLKVILCYYRIKDGDTSLEELANRFGNHPAVIGFKVQDELGSHGESVEQLVSFLTEAKFAIRKHSGKPIMFDVIPWEFWLAGNPSYDSRYPGSKNSAIDLYVKAGLVDWLIIAVSEKDSSISKVLPQAIARWGGKTKVLIRTSASFKGDTFTLNTGSDPLKLRQRVSDAANGGALGIDFYTWQHAGYRLLNKDGTSNPLYEGMRRVFDGFRSKSDSVEH